MVGDGKTLPGWLLLRAARLESPNRLADDQVICEASLKISAKAKSC